MQPYCSVLQHFSVVKKLLLLYSKLYYCNVVKTLLQCSQPYSNVMAALAQRYCSVVKSCYHFPTLLQYCKQLLYYSQCYCNVIAVSLRCYCNVVKSCNTNSCCQVPIKTNQNLHLTAWPSVLQRPILGTPYLIYHVRREEH